MSELTQKDYIDIKGAREHNLKGIDFYTFGKGRRVSSDDRKPCGRTED